MLGVSLAWTPVALTAANGATLTLSSSGEQVVVLSIEELAALPQTTIVTENDFADGAVTYRGPLVRRVIEALALDPQSVLRFTSANDYHVDIPVSDFIEFDAILAMEADGRRLTLRDKGPLWLMYPISDHRALRDPIYVSRLIWQVVGIDAR